MSETEFGCVLAGAAALGAVLVMTSRSNPNVMAPRRGTCASAMRATTTHPEPMLAAGGPSCGQDYGQVSVFDAPTLFPEPTLQTKNVNAIAGMKAQRRTLTEMVSQQLDASRQNKLSGYTVLSVGRCEENARKPSCDDVQQMMLFNSPLDGHTTCK